MGTEIVVCKEEERRQGWMLDGYGLEKGLVRIIAMIIILYSPITDFTQYRHNGGARSVGRRQPPITKNARPLFRLI